MYRSNVIVFPSSLPAEPRPGMPADACLRTRRRCMRLLAAVEAAVTCCIGAGFLFCIGLVICML